MQELGEIVSRCAAAAAGGEAQRLFHGRGRLFPGFEHVAIDGFPPLLLVTFYRPPEPGFEQQLIDALWHALGGDRFNALLVQRRDPGDGRFQAVRGVMPGEAWATEAGLRYRLDLGRGQNHGFFPDMRIARAWLRDRSAGRSVLNLFAFTCAFSVVARAGGAARVVNIDLSRPALTQGRENHRANGLSTDDIHFLDHDVSRSWKKLHSLGRYDIVVMDPPTAQKGSFVAEKDYAKVVRRFPKLLRPAADVLACLNAPHLGEDFLDDIFTRELPGAVKVARLPNPAEFADADPQAGLKVIHYRYERPATLPALDAGDDG